MGRAKGFVFCSLVLASFSASTQELEGRHGECLSSRDPYRCNNVAIAWYDLGDIDRAKALWGVACADGHPSGLAIACENLAVVAQEESESLARYRQACRDGAPGGLKTSCTGVGTLALRQSVALYNGEDYNQAHESLSYGQGIPGDGLR